VSKATIGILDYGAGNTASVRNTISKLGFRSRLVNTIAGLNNSSLLLIPGVGAFPSAMNALNNLELVEPIKEFAHKGNGVIGVCLGMQLLADLSYEHGCTKGLELIPGEVRPIVEPSWHIGWNTLEVVEQQRSIVSDSDGDSFYFNHSYEFQAPVEYVAGVARLDRSVVSVVKKNNIYGFQFHPEKSQQAGLKLMKHTIEGLLNA